MEELLFELNPGELFSVMMQQRWALIEEGEIEQDWSQSRISKETGW